MLTPSPVLRVITPPLISVETQSLHTNIPFPPHPDIDMFSIFVSSELASPKRGRSDTVRGRVSSPKQTQLIQPNV